MILKHDLISFFYRSLSKGGSLFRDILGHLREYAFHEKRKTHNSSYIALYHAGMNSKDLNYILEEISKPEGVIRIAICTIAFGMGINIPDIDMVIHWGGLFLHNGQLAGGRKGKEGWEKSKGPLLHHSRVPLACI